MKIAALLSVTDNLFSRNNRSVSLCAIVRVHPLLLAVIRCKFAKCHRKLITTLEQYMSVSRLTWSICEGDDFIPSIIIFVSVIDVRFGYLSASIEPNRSIPIGRCASICTRHFQQLCPRGNVSNLILKSSVSHLVYYFQSFSLYH